MSTLRTQSPKATRSRPSASAWTQARWLATVLAAALALGCGSGRESEPLQPPRSESEVAEGTPVAIVDGVEISAAAVRREIVKRGLYHPGRSEDEDARGRLIDDLVDFQLVAAEARRRGFDRDPEIVAALDRTLVAKYWQQMYAANADQLRVGDDEVRGYYEAHPDEFEQPEMVRIALLRIRRSASDSEEDRAAERELAARVREEALKQGDAKSFGVLAKEYPADKKSRLRGGDMGWIGREVDDYRIGEAISEAAFALREIGEVSPVVETERGLFLVRLTERREGRRRPLGDVERAIHAKLSAEKQRSVQERALDALREKAEVKIDRDSLAAIGKPPPETVASRPPSFPVGVESR